MHVHFSELIRNVNIGGIWCVCVRFVFVSSMQEKTTATAEIKIKKITSTKIPEQQQNIFRQKDTFHETTEKSHEKSGKRFIVHTLSGAALKTHNNNNNVLVAVFFFFFPLLLLLLSVERSFIHSFIHFVRCLCMFTCISLGEKRKMCQLRRGKALGIPISV